MFKSALFLALSVLSSASYAKDIASCNFSSTETRMQKELVITDQMLGGLPNGTDLIFRETNGVTLDFQVKAKVRAGGEFLFESLQITEGYKGVTASIGWLLGKNDAGSAHPSISLCSQTWDVDCKPIAEIHCYYK